MGFEVNLTYKPTNTLVTLSGCSKLVNDFFIIIVVM